MSGFTRCIGGEARRKQRVAGRIFALSWQVMILSRWKEQEPSGNKDADDFLAAAEYVVSAAARNSTGTGARKQGEAGAAHLTAPAAASVSADAVVEEAFWLKFVENVLEQLVWPALRAGEITKAPKAHVDNPTWWTDGIVPILENERVYQLHWREARGKQNNAGRLCVTSWQAKSFCRQKHEKLSHKKP